ncbi:MAG: hypothetical protein KDA75_15650 [Planctomycetaceae bacterium]|nr:hypothetical protein [Planctomycetaceae bacterium]
MSLRRALQQTSTGYETPFLHYFIDQPLTAGMLSEVCGTIIPDVPRAYDGTRAGDARGNALNANTRCYVTTDNVDQFPHLGELVDDLLSRETIETVETMLRRTMDNCCLRVEVICDRKGFWLQPHKDIKEKRLSMLLYANPHGEGEHLGTDLYDGELKLVKTMPYRNNVGYMFGPANDTWHGLEKKEIRRERRSLLINYVTFDTCWKLPPRRVKSAA